jgi:hypothetical protein
MLAYMSDASNPRNAYPAFWAPFEVVGEGAASPGKPLNVRKWHIVPFGRQGRFQSAFRAFLPLARLSVRTDGTVDDPLQPSAVERLCYAPTSAWQHERRNSTIRVCYRKVKFDPTKALMTRRALLLAFLVLYTSGLLP